MAQFVVPAVWYIVGCQEAKQISFALCECTGAEGNSIFYYIEYSLLPALYDKWWRNLWRFPAPTRLRSQILKVSHYNHKIKVVTGA